MGTYIGIVGTTGTIHRCIGQSVSYCNHSGQRKASINRPISSVELSRIADDRFCRRCFKTPQDVAAARKQIAEKS